MKSSDLTLSIIIIFIFIALYLVNLLVVGIQHIKDNWPLYRCNPMIMPFASVFGYDPKENFGYCIQNIQKNFMGNLLTPLSLNINVLGNLGGNLSDNVADIRKFFDYLRNGVIDAFLSIFSVFFNIMVEMQKTFLKIKDTFGKLTGIMASVLYILSGAKMTMDSVWNGPPGDLVRALCFHPETKLQLKSGEMVEMKNLQLNSVLNNGTTVCAVMQISNLDENGKYVEQMFRVKRNPSQGEDDNDDILVSGSHLIYEPVSKQFIHVEDLPSAAASEENCAVLSCLITSDHTIPIGGWIFHDWEDSNGSAPKKIGK